MSNTTPNNLFIEASRRKLRFNSRQGGLCAEDLWEIPLPSLDQIAVNLDEQIQKAGTKSFLKKRENSTLELEVAFEIVKFVLETRVAEQEEKKTRADKEAKKAHLRSLLAEKQIDALKNLTPEQIQAQIDAL